MDDRKFEIVWAGPGWYGPVSEREGAWGDEITRYYRVTTDAPKDDPFQAGRDAYGSVGTPDWWDSEEEFYQS